MLTGLEAEVPVKSMAAPLHLAVPALREGFFWKKIEKVEKC